MKSSHLSSQQSRWILSLSLLTVLGFDFANLHTVTAATSKSRLPATTSPCGVALTRTPSSEPSAATDIGRQPCADGSSTNNSQAQTDQRARPGAEAGTTSSNNSSSNSSSNSSTSSSNSSTNSSSGNSQVSRDASNSSSSNSQSTDLVVREVGRPNETSERSDDSVSLNPVTHTGVELPGGTRANITYIPRANSSGETIALIQTEGDSCADCLRTVIINAPLSSRTESDLTRLDNAIIASLRASDQASRNSSNANTNSNNNQSRTSNNNQQNSDVADSRTNNNNQETDSFLQGVERRQAQSQRLANQEQRRVDGIIRLCSTNSRSSTSSNDDADDSGASTLRVSCAAQEYVNLLRDRTTSRSEEATRVLQEFYDSQLEPAILRGLPSNNSMANLQSNESFRTVLRMYQTVPASANWLRERLLTTATVYAQQQAAQMQSTVSQYQAAANNPQMQVQLRMQGNQQAMAVSSFNATFVPYLQNSAQTAIGSQNLDWTTYNNQFQNNYQQPMNYLLQTTNSYNQMLNGQMQAAMQPQVQVNNGTTTTPQQFTYIGGQQPTQNGVYNPSVGVPQTQVTPGFTSNLVQAAPNGLVPQYNVGAPPANLEGRSVLAPGASAGRQGTFN